MGDLGHINQRRELESLLRFAAATGPVVQRLVTASVNYELDMMALSEVLRRIITPETDGLQWASMFIQCRAELACCLSIASALQWLYREATVEAAQQAARRGEVH